MLTLCGKHRANDKYGYNASRLIGYADSLNKRGTTWIRPSTRDLKVETH